MDVVVPQDGARAEVILWPHHNPAWKDADRSFQDAHVDVHFEHVYILAVEQGRGEGDHSGVVGTQKLSHSFRIKGRPAGMSSDLARV